MEGHFGNPIVHVLYHLKGEEAVFAVGRIAVLLSKETKDKIMEELDHLVDEHNLLYLRFNKQSLVHGKLELGAEDTVRVKIRPGGYIPKENREILFRRLLDNSQ